MSLKNRANETEDFLDQPVQTDPSRRLSGVQARARRQASLPPAVASSGAPPLIVIEAPADTTLLEPTYAYLSTYCFARFAPSVAERMNVAIYELYANALRYAVSGSEVRFELGRDARGVTLRISNPAEPSSLARLEQQIARVREDAQAAFDLEMSRFGGDSQPPPMLGIVRIAHESRLKLELEVDGARVSISTRCDA